MTQLITLVGGEQVHVLQGRRNEDTVISR